MIFSTITTTMAMNENSIETPQCSIPRIDHVLCFYKMPRPGVNFYYWYAQLLKWPYYILLISIIILLCHIDYKQYIYGYWAVSTLYSLLNDMCPL